MSSSWNNETSITFIEAIRLRPCLWDNTHIEYRNRNLKKDEWSAISTEFGITSEEAQKKPKKEIRVEVSQDSSWFAFKTMIFLKDVDDPDPGKDSDSQLDKNKTPEGEICNPIQSNLPPPTTSIVAQKKKKRNDEDERYETACLVMDDIRKKLNNKTISFGNHVNEKLMTYSDFVRNQVEYKISTILYEADMGYYDRSTSRNGSSTYSSYQYSPQTELVQSPLPSPDTETNIWYISCTIEKSARNTFSNNQNNYSSQTSSSSNAYTFTPLSQTSTVLEQYNKKYEILVSKTIGNTNENSTEIAYDSAQMYSEPFSR
ncbi:hypothetical protein ABEB36_014448 [Hypothenemus hampei]|uniref:MADF domain-containing protein n=1 Tax=Hypothenemus hampei TaxID=57062 RepID=A0ABD1E1T2_HYPHA